MLRGGKRVQRGRVRATDAICSELPFFFPERPQKAKYPNKVLSQSQQMQIFILLVSPSELKRKLVQHRPKTARGGGLGEIEILLTGLEKHARFYSLNQWAPGSVYFSLRGTNVVRLETFQKVREQQRWEESRQGNKRKTVELSRRGTRRASPRRSPSHVLSVS